MKISKPSKRTVALLVIAFSVGVVSFLLTSPNGNKLYSNSSEPRLLTPITENSPSPSPTTKIPPTAIRISKLNKFLPISAALVYDNEWDLFEDKVSWLSTSSVPGEGNVILYAHNTSKLFGDLYKLNAGDVIEIQQDDQWRRYSVTESRKVTPRDVEAVLSEENQLTLYTCEGSFNNKRRVVYASPIVSLSSPAPTF